MITFKLIFLVAAIGAAALAAADVKSSRINLLALSFLLWLLSTVITI